MITLTSNDDVQFTVYSRALVRDSKRFMLQQKYQSLDSNISVFNGTILSYYVDFINEGSVVIDREYETELLSLADYMTSPRFDHEIKWQLWYKHILTIYIKYGDHQRESGVLYEFFTHGPLDISSLLKAMSVFILDIKIRDNIDIMTANASDIKQTLFYHLFPDNDGSDNGAVLSEIMDYVDYKYMTSASLFESVYGNAHDIVRMIERCENDEDCIHEVGLTLMDRQTAYESRH